MINQARRINRGNRRVKANKNKRLIGHGLREIVLIFFGFVALYLFVSLLTYYGGDPGWSHSGPVEEIRNKGGVAGALFADTFLYLFGFFAYLFPIMVGYMGWLIYQGRHHDILAEPKNLIVPGIGFVLTLSAGCGLAIVHFMAESALLPTHAGGILGLWIGNGLVSIVDRLGATLILLALFFTGVTLLTGLSWLKLMDTLGYHTLLRLPVIKKYMGQQFLPWFLDLLKRGLQVIKNILKFLFNKLRQWTSQAFTRFQKRRAEWREEREREQYDIDDDDYYYDDDFEDKERVKNKQPIVDVISPKSQPTLSDTTPITQTPLPQIIIKTQALLPALSLLEPVSIPSNSPDIQILSQQMKDAFATLQVEVDINTVRLGPVLNGFEVNPITPINTNHLDKLGDELADVLKVENVRVVENQPGVLSVEIPSSQRQTIYLSELLNSPEYQDNISPLAVALGCDVSGQPVVVDLTRVPHILIAGNDAEEKNMAIDTLILSLLFKSAPEKMRLLLIDNNEREFSVYADLPHLLVPIITDIEQISPALQWCIQEMERRYRLMASMEVRNIEDYNQAQLLQTNENVSEDTESNTALFYVVVIINEIAQLMTTTLETQIDKSITRLAQKARAAGIHIILATHYPTVNVITGLIKTNIPTRMAFRVTNKSESRTILGQIGAETLFGQGDMLYMTAGTGMPVRVHSSYASDTEVQNVIADLKARAVPSYIDLSG